MRNEHVKVSLLVEADPRQFVKVLGGGGRLVQVLWQYQAFERNRRSENAPTPLQTWVPRELMEAQKNQRHEMCSSLLQRHYNEPFLNRLVTCDGKWILYDN